MKKAISFMVLLQNILFAIALVPAWGWNDEITHRSLSSYAADESILAEQKGNVISLLGFKSIYEVVEWPGNACKTETNKAETKCSIKDWLKEGAEKEDKSIEILFMTRTVNHFHDPYRDRGLNDLGTGLSALVWAQDGDSQSAALEGDQSWHTLRTFYWTALTAQSEEARQEWFARMFKGLGHQMHLVQDMAVPYHVRNDAHLSDAFLHVSPRGIRYFESWAKKNPGIVNDIAANKDSTTPPVFPTLDYGIGYTDALGNTAPCPSSQLWDTDYYDGDNPSATQSQGLAEYTNANFYSEDTMSAAEDLDPDDKHYFPHPALSDLDFDSFLSALLLPKEVWADDGNMDYRCYIAKTGGGETVDEFVAVGYFSEYAKQLVPA